MIIQFQLCVGYIFIELSDLTNPGHLLNSINYAVCSITIITGLYFTAANSLEII